MNDGDNTGKLATVEERQRLLLVFSSTLWGLGIAMSLIGSFIRSAPPDQAVGYLSARDIDASAIFAFIPVLVALSLTSAIFGRWLSDRFLTAGGTNRFLVIASVSLAWGLWLGVVQTPTMAVLVLPLAGVGLAAVTRRRAARWSAEDIILLPVTISLFNSIFDLFPTTSVGVALSLAMLFVVVMRIGVASLLPDSADAARAFVLAPLGIVVQSTFVDYPVRSAGWPALIFTVITPPALAWVLHSQPRFNIVARRTAVWLVFPLVIFAFPSTQGLGFAESLPRVHLFEDGHNLMPASEMARGELPWKDVVPGHGLISDGLLDLAAMKIADERLGRILHWRWRFASLTPIAIYLLVLAATRSAEAGLGAFFLGYILGAGPFLRAVFSILAMAAAVGAVVHHRARLFALSGILFVLSGLLSLDFAVYAGAAIAVAIPLFGDSWRAKREALGMAAGGVALATVPLFLVLLGYGILDDFFRTTFFEILPLGAAYSLGFPELAAIVPPPWTIPEMLIALLARPAFPYLGWLLTLIVVSVLVAAGKRTGSWSAPIIIGVWILASAVSWVERHHFYFMLAVPALLTVLIVIGWRKGGDAARGASAALVVLIAIGQPTSRLTSAASVRLLPPGPSTGWSELHEVRRARGALFRESDVENLRLMNDLIGQHLKAGETWFDFADAPILYYLFDREAPIRQYEVAFYQSEALQREVIAQLESDPDVRFALLRFPTEAGHSIDGVPNEVRAPLVAEYLRQNFEVVLDTGEIRIAARRVAHPHAD